MIGKEVLKALFIPNVADSFKVETHYLLQQSHLRKEFTWFEILFLID